MLTHQQNFVGQPVSSESHLEVALYKTTNACLKLGFDQVATSKITTAASELIRNILKYAGNGQFCLCAYVVEDKKGIEMTVSDKGPGIADLQCAMTDKHSSGGTLGLGLPGVERLMDYFCIKSELGKGTTVTVRKFL